ncbi:MAG: hypothetical protein ACKO1N_08995, partial [Erythrobacter sp.]
AARNCAHELAARGNRIKGTQRQAGPPPSGIGRDSASVQPVQGIDAVMREGSRIFFGHEAGLNE